MFVHAGTTNLAFQYKTARELGCKVGCMYLGYFGVYQVYAHQLKCALPDQLRIGTFHECPDLLMMFMSQ